MTAAAAHAFGASQLGTYTPEQFRDYWYNHGAEISRFSLQQMRYGQIHEGDSVLVFVTEKMHPGSQIKADNPGSEDIAVLKWNETYRGLAGMEAKVLTTRATRTHTIMDAYWRHNGNQDRKLLKKLGLGARELEAN